MQERTPLIIAHRLATVKNLNGIVVFEAGKLIARIKSPWTFNELAGGLHMSPSQVHAAAKRALRAKLAVEE